MKIYLCVSDTAKKKCESVTIVDTTVHCRELLCYLNFFSYRLRIYEHEEKRTGTITLKVFAVVQSVRETMDNCVVKGDVYGKVSNRVLGEV